MDSLQKKVKQKAKLMEDDDLPSCWGKFVLLDDVLNILEDYNIRPKPNELVESTAEAFSRIHDEINRQLKFHGIFRSETSIIIDAKQAKFVVVEREKLRELLTDIPTCVDCKYCVGDMKGNSHCSLESTELCDGMICPIQKWAFETKEKFELLFGVESTKDTKKEK